MAEVKIIYREKTSPVFELVKTVEVDLALDDENGWTNRIEIFRDTERPNFYRCRVWELESFRLTPSFPRNEAQAPVHATDDTIMIERGIAGSEIAARLNKPFEAASAEDALEMIVEELSKFLHQAAPDK